MKTHPLSNQLLSWLLSAMLLFSFACTSSKEQKEETSGEEESQSGMMEYSTQSEEALQAFDDGIQHFFLGNPMKAREKFDEALEADPNFAMATVYRGFTSRSAKEFADYGNKASELKASASEGEKLMIEIYQTLLKAAMTERMEFAKKLSESFPNDPLAQYELTNLYGAMEMESERRAHLQGMVDEDPKNAVAALQLAGSYIFTDPKDFTKAEKLSKMAVDAAPDMPGTHIALGDYYRSQNQLNEALNAYKKASELDNTNVIALSKQGHANTYLGNYDAARENFKQAMNHTDNTMGMVVFTANTYLYNGDYETAYKTIETAAAEIPNKDMPEDRKRAQSSNCAWNCSMIALHNRDAKRLEKYVTKLNELSTKIGEDIGTTEAATINKADNILWESRLAMVKGDFDTAKAKAEEYKSMISSFDNPGFMQSYHFTMGLIAMDEKNAEKAIEHFKQTDKYNVFEQYHLAKAYEMNGQEDKAKEVYKKWKDYNFNNLGYAMIRNEIQAKAS